MLVSCFRCPECSATLKPSKPQPEGKRIKCPKCDTVFSVAPLDSEDSVEEEPETRTTARKDLAPKAASSRGRPADDFEDDEDQDDSRPRRSRRASREEDDEEDDDRPSPTRRRQSKSKKKQSNRGILWIGVGIAVILAVLGGIGVLVVFVIMPLTEDSVHKRIRALNEATQILTKVNDQATADSSRPSLVKIGDRLHALDLEDKAKMEAAAKYLKEHPNAIQDAAKNAKFTYHTTDPQEAKAMMDKVMEPMRLLGEAQQGLAKEIQRVWQVPGGKDLIKAFLKACDTQPIMYGILDEANNPGFPFPRPPMGNQPMPVPPMGNQPPPGPPNQGGATAKFNRDDWAKVQLGMTENQVSALIGPPTAAFDNPDGRVLHCHGDGMAGILTFRDGKLVKKFPD